MGQRRPGKKQIEFLRAIQQGNAMVRDVGGRRVYAVNLGYGWGGATADVERLIGNGWVVVSQLNGKDVLTVTDAGRAAQPYHA